MELDDTSSAELSTEAPASALASLEKAEAAASSAGTPEVPATGVTPGAPAAATVQPGTPGTKASTPGPIPFDRHQSILDNTRKEVEGRYGWAKDMNPEDAKLALQLLGEIRTDPRKFYGELSQRLGVQQPQTGAPEKTEDPLAFPQPELVAQDGKTRAYSDRQIVQIADIIKKQVLGELRPVTEFYESETESRQAAAVQAEAKAIVTPVMEHARTLPHFKDNEELIKAEFLKTPPALRAQIGPVAAMYRAYNTVLAAKVFPTVNADAEKKVRETNQRKVATSQGVHPVDTGGAQAKPVKLRDGNVNDLAAHMARLEQELSV